MANESSRLAANTPVIRTVLKATIKAARQKLSTRTGYALLSMTDDAFWRPRLRNCCATICAASWQLQPRAVRT